MMIGKRLRALRKARNMSLTELAEKSGVQIATLSRIENMKMTGTVDSHARIARALEVELPELYKEETPSEGPPPLRRPLETFTYNEKASYEILATRILNKKMMPVLLRIEPGGRTHPEQYPSGSERFLFVLEGQVEVHAAEYSHTLGPRQALYLNAALRHEFINVGEGTAKILSVLTPVTL